MWRMPVLWPLRTVLVTGQARGDSSFPHHELNFVLSSDPIPLDASLQISSQFSGTRGRQRHARMSFLRHQNLTLGASVLANDGYNKTCRLVLNRVGHHESNDAQAFLGSKCPLLVLYGLCDGACRCGDCLPCWSRGGLRLSNSNSRCLERFTCDLLYGQNTTTTNNSMCWDIRVKLQLLSLLESAMHHRLQCSVYNMSCISKARQGYVKIPIHGDFRGFWILSRSTDCQLRSRMCLRLSSMPPNVLLMVGNHWTEHPGIRHSNHVCV